MKLIQRTGQDPAPGRGHDKDPHQGPEDANLVQGQVLAKGGHTLAHLPDQQNADLAPCQVLGEKGGHAHARLPEIDLGTGDVDLAHLQGIGIIDDLGAGKGGDLDVQGQGSESLDHVTGPKKEKSPLHRRGLRRKKGNQPRIFRRIKTEKKRRTERNRKRGQKQRKGDLRIKTEPKKRNWKKKKNAKEKGRRKNKKKRKEKEKEKGKGKEKGNERNAKEKRRGKGKRNEKENDKGNRSVKKSETEAEQDQGVHHCHHHLKDIIREKRNGKPERKSTAAHRARMKKATKKETFQRAMKKERKRRRVNDMVAQNWRIVETQITKGVRKKRKSIQRTTTLTRTCLTKKNTAVSNGRNEMKDTGKIEAIEMTEKTEDQRRNHGATKRNLSVLRIMIATVTEILSGTFTYEFTFKVNLEILSRKCVWSTVLFGDLGCPVHQ